MFLVTVILGVDNSIKCDTIKIIEDVICMSKLEKLLEKIKNNPKAVRFEELDRILIAGGFVRRQPKGGSSHYVYQRDEKTICVPFRQPHILRIYVELAIELIGDCFGEPEGESDEEGF